MGSKRSNVRRGNVGREAFYKCPQLVSVVTCIARHRAEGCRRLGAAKKKLRPGHLVNALPCSLCTRGLITCGCIDQAVLLRSLSTVFCYEASCGDCNYHQLSPMLLQQRRRRFVELFVLSLAYSISQGALCTQGMPGGNGQISWGLSFL